MHIIDQIKETLKAIVPLDTQKMKNLQFASDWIDSGSGIFRLEKPAIPNPHLVAYFLLLDPLQKKVLFVDHKNAGLWLPAGGHVELNEHPKDTVKREVVEELSIEASFLLEEPFFLTVSETAGQGTKHTDVSLWYLLKGCANTQYAFDKSLL